MDTTNTRVRRQVEVLKEGVSALKEAAWARQTIRVAAQPTDQKSHQLAKIEAALSRMADGSYGYCQSCGAPISLSKLEADPTATICDKCED